MSARSAAKRQSTAKRRLALRTAVRLGQPDRSILLHRAIAGLAEQRPTMSARKVVSRGQTIFFSAFAGMIVSALFVRPHEAADVVVAAMAIGFVYSLILRCGLAVLGNRPSPVIEVARDEKLPVYSILVPVYREAGMIAQLARALAALDYPADRLDIRLVVEEDDRDTRDAVALAGLAAVVVPPSEPRTKPKACNFALSLARGEFIVVYDAEDRPEPNQLRKAVAAFRSDPMVSCFQARLAIDQTPGWIAQMFAIDYDVWFRTLLPGLARLRAPIPLGGTSNHFRTKALVEAGAWDPYNVTEDADLGVRLARLGHRVAILDSTTFEEAPKKLGIWLCQRTRWMKGYLQTLLVHSRNPRALLREIGPGGVTVILSFLGGAVWSSLVNPLMWIICIGGAVWQGDGTLAFLSRISGITLLAANGLLAALAMSKGGRWAPQAAFVLTYPLYWLLISAATYRALWQLPHDTFRWEKTPHGGAPQ